MRVHCDVCETAVAEVICCADEAALCSACDVRVHAANKLASKHQRLRLLDNSTPTTGALPLCDICQEKVALIFCLEDRAVLCRDCDVSIHASNTLAANHKRFLSTGIRVSLHAEQQGPVNVSQDKPHDSIAPPRPPAQVVKKIMKPPTDSESARSSSASSSPLQSTQSSPPVFHSEASDPRSNSIKPSITKPLKRTAAQQSDNVPAFQAEKKAEEWQAVNNVLDLGIGYPLGDTTSSKADLMASLMGDEDWIADLNFFDEHMIAEALAEVPQMTPVATNNTMAPSHGRLDVPKGKYKQDIVPLHYSEDVSVVPDIGTFVDYVPSMKRQKMFPGM